MMYFFAAPGTRVMFLLKEKSDLPALFTEMGELGGKEWRETARWVKFEEDVEQGWKSHSRSIHLDVQLCFKLELEHFMNLRPNRKFYILSPDSKLGRSFLET